MSVCAWFALQMVNCQRVIFCQNEGTNARTDVGESIWERLKDRKILGLDSDKLCRGRSSVRFGSV